MIPKIIHQTGYALKSKWHPIWNLCYKSVQKVFNDFEHVFWTDEKIDYFIKKNYKEYYKDYQKIPFHIIQLDLFRYALLYKYGGIYIDMDMYCYRNFYSDLTSNINLVESDCPDEHNQPELVQNSLMAATPNQKFFKECFIEGLQRSKTIKFKKSINDNHFNVKYVSGPLLLKNMVRKFKNIYKIKILPLKFFNTTNNHIYEKQHKVRHMASGMWGKEIYKSFLDLQEAENFIGSIEKYHKLSYLDKTKMDIDTLDFYKTYVLKP